MKKIIFISGLIISIIIYLITNYSFKNVSEINISISTEIKSFDPAKAFNDDSLNVISQVLEPLYQYHYLKRPYEVIPLIADGMPTYLNDNKTIQIKIRKGIFYHGHIAFNGRREVKAVDFINQIKRLSMSGGKSNGRWIFSDRLKGFDTFSKSINSVEELINKKMSGLELIDDYTFNLHLVRPDSKIIYFLAMNFVTPIPAELIRYTENNLDKVLIGTGPFIYSNLSNSEKIVLTENLSFNKQFYPVVGDRYANVHNLLEAGKKRIPFIKKINIHIIKDANQMWNSFIAKDIDMIEIPKEYISKVIKPEGSLYKKYREKGIVSNHFSSLSSRWLSFNMNDKLWGQNKDLRKAIAFAIDYSEYIEVLTQNTSFRANGLIVPAVPGYDPTRKLKYNFNLVKAKELIKQAGYPNGRGLPVLKYSTRTKSEASILEGTLVKKFLSKIGIKVEIEELEFGEFLKKGRSGKLQFFTDQWIYDYPDAENFIQLLISKNHPGINKSGFSNKKVDQLYLKLLSVKNDIERNEIINDIEKIIEANVPWIMLSYDSSYILNYSKVKNIRKSSVIRNIMKYIDIND
jgi:oligopeptide transport system substrate-binding protein